MDFLRRFRKQDSQAQTHVDPLVNPQRTPTLFAPTAEGYIIAQDIGSQYEYATEHAHCPECGGQLQVMAQINRAGQGLNEMVCVCLVCYAGCNLLFDISNEVYQAWLADMMGELYIQNYDGPPREPAQTRMG